MFLRFFLIIFFVSAILLPPDCYAVARYNLKVISINGTVTGAGISCGGSGNRDCSEVLPAGTDEVLTASPSKGYKFVNWKGCDKSNANQCTVTMNKSRTVTATFAKLKLNTLSVIASPNNFGRVTSEPAGIVCGNGQKKCTVKYIEGDLNNSVALNAAAVKGYKFVSWRGCTADPVVADKCSVTVNANKTVQAIFKQVLIPRAPIGVNAVAGNGKATINWKNSADAASYNVYYKTTAGVTRANGMKVAGALSGISITGLTNGTAYYFVVTAVNVRGESGLSAEVRAKPQVLVPSAPTGVNADAGNGQAAITWLASSGAVSYNIYYSTTAGVTTGNGTKISGATSGGAITGLSNGTVYYFVVTAVNAEGESAVSSEVIATPQAPPDAPTLNIPMPGDGRVTLSWSATTTGGPVVSYKVYYSAGTTVTTADMEAALGGASISYMVNGLTNATQYAFIVTAVNAIGESIPSNVVLATPVGIWTTKASLTFQRDNAATAVLQGLIYVMGGAPAGISVLDSLEAYDPTTDIWTTKAPMPAPRYGLAAVGVNGLIYALGGTNQVNGQDPIYPLAVYDPTTDGWSGTVPGTSTLLAPIPTGRWGFDAAVVDGLIYAIGGAVAVPLLDAYGNSITTNAYFGTVEAYDPVANTWTTKATMPTPRWGMTVSVVNGLIYAIGGWAGWPELSVVEVYDPATDTWSTTIPGTSTLLTPMPTARDDFGFAVVNGLIYAIGGDINAYDPYVVPAIPCCTTVMEAYDPVTNTWTTKAPMPTMRDDFDAVVMDGVIYALAGSLDGRLAGGGISYTTVEAYSSSNIPTPRGLTAALSGNQVSLNWTSVDEAVSYNIYWSNKAGLSTSHSTKITGTASPYVQTGLTTGEWYYYTVTAVTPSGESLLSNEVSVNP